MEVIAACIPGLEEITQLEIKEILKKKSKAIIPSRVSFNLKDDKDLAYFIYSSRSIIKAYKLIKHFKFTDLDSILNEAKKVKFPKIKEPFAVKCERKGKHNFNSADIEKEIGDIINKDGKLKVDLSNPNTTIIVDIINNDCFLGIDYTGIKLSKRNYKVRLLANPLNSCLAYCMARIADIREKDIILDPFCRSGEIPIESALYLQGISVNSKILDKLAFTKLVNFKPKNKIQEKKLEIYAIDSLQNNLKTTEINAKMAGVNKFITFSRYDIEWMDTKFKKNSVDKIITYPPYPTRNIPEKIIEKIYKEFFYQAEFVLKDKGIIVLLTPAPELIEKYSIQYKFKKCENIEINYQEETFFILKLKKETF